MIIIFGLIASVFAFLCGAVGYHNLIGHNFSTECSVGFVLGAIVFGGFLYWHASYLQETCNPPEQVWPVPLPIAWGCVKDVLQSSTVVANGSSAGWHIQQEDDSRGIIAAQVNFSQQLGAGSQAENYPRSISCNVQLSAEGSKTRVKTSYQIVSPMGQAQVLRVIETTQLRLRELMLMNKARA